MQTHVLFRHNLAVTTFTPKTSTGDTDKVTATSALLTVVHVHSTDAPTDFDVTMRACRSVP